MPSPLSSALAKLDDSVRSLEEQLDSLRAGLDVLKDQFVQKVTDARQNADAVRELVRAEHPDVDWTDRESLENLIRELEAAESGRKQERRRKLADLADELSAGTITHRLKSRVTALEALRAAAVRELRVEAAKEEPKELPGPEALAWVPWACALQGSSNGTQSAELERDFPQLVGFVFEMEESYWEPREGTRTTSPRVARDESPSQPPPNQRAATPLTDAAPAFAARYGHLSAAKASQPETKPTETAAPAAVAQPSEVRQAEPVQSATAASVDAARSPAAVLANPVPRSIPTEKSPQDVAEKSIGSVEAASTGTEHFIFQSYPGEQAEAGGEPKRSGFSRSLLITVGLIVAIIVVIGVVYAVNGKLPGKRSADVTTAASPATSSAQTAAPVSDIELVGQIEQRLKAIQGSSIYVTVQHGTAILEGQVPSEDALAQAEVLTLQSSQIKVVRNRLQVAKAGAVHPANHPATTNPANSQ